MALRTPLPVQPNLYMTDTEGRPLDGGKVYFGESGKDPEIYPIDIFYDELLTIAAPQPVITKNGFLSASGNTIGIYGTATSYSVKVLDAHDVQVLYISDMTRLDDFGAVLAAEIDRATSAEQELESIVTNSVDSTQTLVSNLDTKLTNDVSNLQVKDTSLQNQINSVGGGKKAYTTEALMIADKANIAAHTSIDVTNDPTTSKNGTYTYNGTVFTKSVYDPASVVLSKVANTFATQAIMIASSLPDDSFAVVTEDPTLDKNGYYQKKTGTWVKSTLDPLLQTKQYVAENIDGKISGVAGKNLFDKTKITTGVALNDAGTTFTASARNVSSYIAAKPSTAYSFSNINKAVFYDINKAFLSVSTGANANVISPLNTAFVRIDIGDSNLNTAQVELGTVKTPYESYRIVIANNSVSTSAMQDNSVNSDKLQSQSVSARHFKNAVFLNMLDVDTMLIEGVTLSTSDGVTEIVAASVDITTYIDCKPSTQYVTKDASNVYYYTREKAFISTTTAGSFTTPANCYYIRFKLSANTSFRTQVNEGTTLPSVIPQPYKYTLPQLNITPQTKLELNKTLARKYSFLDAWVAWRDGQKFPVVFLGDSTTNGNGTTGFSYRDAGASLGEDYIAPNSYTSVFQALIREITGNTQMRAYNAGFSGRNSSWAIANIDAIMGGAYADAKMIGISHGINDRTASAELYATNFYREIEALIKWCLEHGYQPFLMTTQPMTMPLYIGDGDGSDTQEVANGIKKTLADKYGLELVDVNKWGQDFMQYSTKPLLNNIMESGGNIIHFGDGGHKYTAELLFAKFCQRCIWTTNGEQLDYSTQLNKSDINHTYISQMATFKNGFKNQTLATHTDATDKKYQEYWVFNATRRQLDLTAYFANAVVGQYVLVDGVQTTITTQGQSLGSLDLGLHKIKAYSSATTALDWLGFKLQ